MALPVLRGLDDHKEGRGRQIWGQLQAPSAIAGACGQEKTTVRLP